MILSRKTASGLTIAALLIVGFVACDDLEREEKRAYQEDVCEYTPAPRWVLRDNAGKRVQALVEPRCGNNAGAPSFSRCLPLDFGSSSSFPCVRIIDHEGRYVNVQYELATGRLEPCLDDGSDAFDKWEDGVTFHLDPACEGVTHQLAERHRYYAPEFTTSRDFFNVGGKFWALTEDCVPSSHPQWQHSPGECAVLTQTDLCTVEPVPEWVLDLLPNPPYTMAVEYE